MTTLERKEVLKSTYERRPWGSTFAYGARRKELNNPLPSPSFLFVGSAAGQVVLGFPRRVDA
jgi:hypothetical protein